MKKNFNEKRNTRRPEWKGHKKDYNKKSFKKNSDVNAEKEAMKRSVDDVHTNDISWWNRAKPLFDDATRVPFNRIQGDPIINTSQFNTLVTNSSGNEAFPGIMTIHYVPSIGYATNSNDPVNRSFNSIYADIYSRTTGAMQFTQGSLALFTLGISSIIQMIGVMKRVLGMCQLYAAKNYYYPRHLITAMGFTPDSIIPNQDDLRRRLNQCIQSVNAMKVPNFIDLFKRHYTLASNVWLDEDVPDAQMFIFVPDKYYQYDDTNNKLSAVNTDLANTTGAVFLDKIEAALTLWRNSSDLGLISGSIQRAYKDSSLISLEMVSVDSVTLPVFDKVMMSQINNATIIGPVSNIDVTEDVVANVIKFEPKVLGTSIGSEPFKFAACLNERIVNSWDGDISPESIMEMTRLVTIGTWNGTDLILDNCGTELITTCKVWYTTRTSASAAPTMTSASLPVSYGAKLATDPVSTLIDQFSKLSSFRNGPRFTTVLYTGAGPFAVSGIYRWGDLNIWTTIDKYTYNGLNQAALQSIYVVNEVTKPNRI